MTAYEVIIGMEVHIELQTQSKMFCGCSADFFGVPPNVHTCPVCLAMPGALPVINRQAVADTVLMGLALGCTIHPHNVFARKNYFYPDLPKGYQISQYELPLCTEGVLLIDVGDQTRRIGITRVHLEEDTGKSTHVDGYSLIDLNRAGVPLLEIVSEPDLRSAEETFAYISKLRQIVRYLGISSGDMEKGAMRCEVNLSLRPVGSTTWGTKVEVKNLNSFRAVRNAIEYEVERQTRLLDAGGSVEQVTLGWDESRRVTLMQRSKEDARDYRYFPEPDLPPLNLTESWIEALRASLPELPDAKIERYATVLGLAKQDAAVLAEYRDRADYFDALVVAGVQRLAPRAAANWLTGEVFRLLNESGLAVEAIKVTPGDLVALLELVENKTISRMTAKDVFAAMWANGQAPASIVEAKGLQQISDSHVLQEIVAQVIDAHPGPVEQYRAGEEKVLKFLIGQVMRHSKGQANPQLAEELLREAL